MPVVPSCIFFSTAGAWSRCPLNRCPYSWVPEWPLLPYFSSLQLVMETLSGFNLPLLISSFCVFCCSLTPDITLTHGNCGSHFLTYPGLLILCHKIAFCVAGNDFCKILSKAKMGNVLKPWGKLVEKHAGCWWEVGQCDSPSMFTDVVVWIGIAPRDSCIWMLGP